jgi:hypothetical protein
MNNEGGPKVTQAMLSQTRHAIEEFDNQHDFERMAADVLNALGYQSVEPMAPGGGGDGGKDIKFREALQKHLGEYYRFREDALRIEGNLVLRIGQMVSVRFPEAWRIYLRYVLLRFGGASKDAIESWGDFLNYSITWNDAERVFNQLSVEATLSSEISTLLQFHENQSQEIKGILLEG